MTQTKESHLEKRIQQTVYAFPTVGVYYLGKASGIGTFRLDRGYHFRIEVDEETVFSMDYIDELGLKETEGVLHVSQSTLAGRLYSAGFVDMKKYRRIKKQKNLLKKIKVDLLSFLYLAGYPKMKNGMVRDRDAKHSLMAFDYFMEEYHQFGILSSEIDGHSLGANAFDVLKLYQTMFKAIRLHHDSLEKAMLKKVKKTGSVKFGKFFNGVENTKGIFQVILNKYGYDVPIARKQGERIVDVK